MEGYTVHLSSPEKNKSLPSNIVSTTKYSLISFIPKCTFYQFSRLANLYFLLSAMVMFIPQITPLDPFTALGPLIGVLIIAMIKQGIQDWVISNQSRRKNDKQVNFSICQKWNNKWDQIYWKDLKAGDIVKTKQGQNFPADLLLLTSTSEAGDAKIQTANLDGEQNLKTKQALTSTIGLFEEDRLRTLPGDISVSVNEPNDKLYNFSGYLEIDGQKYWVESKNLLWRGCNLRNTEYVVGMVVYPGKYSKIMMNSNTTRFKRSRFDKQLNNIVLFELCFQTIICVFLAFSAAIFQQDNEDAQYIYYGYHYNPIQTGLMTYATFFILLNSLIPLSLIVSLEFVKFMQFLFIEFDLELVDHSQNLRGRVFTLNIIQELGLIDYVFTDKTGTLTSNCMEFRGCAIGERVYQGSLDMHFLTPKLSYQPSQESQVQFEGKNYAINITQIGHYSESVDKKQEVKWGFLDSQLQQDFNPVPINQNFFHTKINTYSQKQLIQEFFVCLITCNQIVTEQNEDYVKYMGASPDQVTLVDAAKQLGFVFVQRRPDSILVQIKEEVYQIQVLAINQFTSERRRMSVVVKLPDGTYKLYLKGADSTVQKLLGPEQQCFSNCQAAVQSFAQRGFRTLSIAFKQLDQLEVLYWFNKYKAEKCSFQSDSQEKLLKLAQEIENDLFLLGVTAIQDTLQEGVPQTLVQLQKAGIKVWMITGDKLQTAQNVGFLSGLTFKQWDNIIIQQASNDIKLILQKIQPDLTKKHSLIIDGDSFAAALNFPSLLYRACLNASSVIIARANPRQKAEAVRFIKKMNKNCCTLAIGDGGNDIPMIQKANVGVGIFGKQGHQAASSSDFAIGQFRFLRTLLFIHGRWNAQRTGFYILYFFFKNIFITLPQFFFAFQSGFSGQTLWEDWYVLMYNSVITAIGLFVYGVLQQDVNPRITPQIWPVMPFLYKETREFEPMNMKKFIFWVGYGVYSASALYGIGIWMYRPTSIDIQGHSEGLWGMSISMYTGVVLVVNILLAIHFQYWTVFHYIGVWVLGLVLYFPVFVFVYDLVPGTKIHRSIISFVSPPVFWLTAFTILVACVMPMLVFRLDQKIFTPKLVDKVIAGKVFEIGQEEEDTKNKEVNDF